MADSDTDGDEAHTLRPAAGGGARLPDRLQRAGHKVLTLRGAMPRKSTSRQALCTDVDGFSLHVAAGAVQRRRAGGAEAQDPVA